MADKNRERNCDKEKYKKKQKKKKEIKQKREAQAISRKKRNYVRKQIKFFYDAFRELKNKHLLFVLKDTENMERIILQKNDIGNGLTLLALPVINEDMINEFLNIISPEVITSLSLSEDKNAAIKAFINHYYSLNSDNITDLFDLNMMVFKDCQLLKNKDELLQINVRPYNEKTWYESEHTTVNGVKVYKGNKLKTFFKIDEDLGKTYIFHDTISEILLYKSLMGKIDIEKLLADNEMLAKKKLLSQAFKGLYLTIFTDDEEIERRFENEELEDNDLESR